MAVRPPEAFIKLCQRFYQDVGEDHPSLDSLVGFGLRGVTDEDRKVLVPFLDELLSVHMSDEELNAIWWSTPADVYFGDSEQLVKFLSLLRSKLGE